MANVAPAKPTSVSGQIITGGKLGTAGTDFFFKVSRHYPNFVVPDVETTGDGDAAPAWEASDFLYLSGVMYGWMLAQSVGTFSIVNMITAAKNPLAASLKFNFATSQVLTIPKTLITSQSPLWDRKSPVIPLVIRYKATDSHPTWGTT